MSLKHIFMYRKGKKCVSLFVCVTVCVLKVDVSLRQITCFCLSIYNTGIHLENVLATESSARDEPHMDRARGLGTTTGTWYNVYVTDDWCQFGDNLVSQWCVGSFNLASSAVSTVDPYFCVKFCLSVPTMSRYVLSKMLFCNTGARVPVSAAAVTDNASAQGLPVSSRRYTVPGSF